MLWFALAALASLPALVNGRPDVRAIFTVDDFPAYLQQAGVSRTVYTRTTVRPDGSLESCAVEASSGDTKLDAYTCALIVKRAKFRPATWSDGTPVYGVIRVPVGWTISNAPIPEEDRLKATTPDLELTLNKLPKGARSIAAVSLEVEADKDGRVVSCSEQPPLTTSDRRKHFPDLVTLGCQGVTENLKVAPPVDASGNKVRSVQTVSVHFLVRR
jgi:TonB family protein